MQIFLLIYIFHRICHGGVESMNERVQGTRSPPVNLSVSTDSHSPEVKRDSYCALPAEGGVVATIKSEVYSNQQQERQPYHHVPYQQSTQEAHSSYGKEEQRSMPDSTFEDSYNCENMVRDCSHTHLYLPNGEKKHPFGDCTFQQDMFS